ETSALESRWKMDRVPFRPRGRQRERSVLGAAGWWRRSGKIDRLERRRRRFRLVAGFETDRARRPRSRSARAGEKGEGKEDSSAAGDRSPLFQEGHRRLPDRALFAFAIVRSRDAQDRAAHFRQTR